MQCEKIINIIIAIIVLSGCSNREENANMLFVEMVQSAQMAAQENNSHTEKYKHYMAAKMIYDQIIDKYPETSIALKLSTGEAEIAGKSSFVFLQLNQQLHEKSELEKDPFSILVSSVLSRDATKNSMRLLASIMNAYAKAGRTKEAAQLYRSINNFFEVYKDQSNREQFKIEGGLSYAALIKTTDSEIELINSFELAKKKYGLPKSTKEIDLYFKFAEAFVTQQKTDIAEDILKDLEREDYKDAFGNTDFDYIVKVAEVYALFDKEYSIRLAENALSELLGREGPRFSYEPELLKLIYREGQEQRFKEDFKRVFSWSMLKGENKRIYVFLELAKLIKELNLTEAKLISIESVKGSYRQDDYTELSMLGEFYSALGFDLLAIDAFDQAVTVASYNNKDADGFGFYWVAEALARNGYYTKSDEINNLIKSDSLKKSTISWMAKTQAKNGEYLSAMQTFNRMDDGFANTWIYILAEQMQSGTLPSYQFIEESHRAFLKLKID